MKRGLTFRIISIIFLLIAAVINTKLTIVLGIVSAFMQTIIGKDCYENIKEKISSLSDEDIKDMVDYYTMMVSVLILLSVTIYGAFENVHIL